MVIITPVDGHHYAREAGACELCTARMIEAMRLCRDVLDNITQTVRPASCAMAIAFVFACAISVTWHSHWFPLK
jgi:hypothetical protein